jgi:hypothetical protein
MPGSQTTRGQADTRAGVSVGVAFHETYRVGTPEKITYAAQRLACTLPYRRFAGTLADACARLGVDADRYSFIAADSHRLLLAGLPAHKLLISAGMACSRGRLQSASPSQQRPDTVQLAVRDPQALPELHAACPAARLHAELLQPRREPLRAMPSGRPRAISRMA